jgi:hypothetical protein
MLSKNRFLVSGFLFLVSSFWFLVSGFWFLVSRLWLLVTVISTSLIDTILIYSFRLFNQKQETRNQKRLYVFRLLRNMNCNKSEIRKLDIAPTPLKIKVRSTSFQGMKIMEHSVPITVPSLV